MKRKDRKAQSFLGYAILITIAVAGLLAMRTYMVRAVQEKYRQSVDVFGEGEQYERGVTQVTESATSLDIAAASGDSESYSTIRDEVAALEKNIADLLVRAESLDAQAAHLREQAEMLSETRMVRGRRNTVDFTAQQAQLNEMAINFEKQAQVCREEAAGKQEQVAQLKIEYPEYFHWFFLSRYAQPEVALAEAK